MHTLKEAREVSVEQEANWNYMYSRCLSNCKQQSLIAFLELQSQDYFLLASEKNWWSFSNRLYDIPGRLTWRRQVPEGDMHNGPLQCLVTLQAVCSNITFVGGAVQSKMFPNHGILSFVRVELIGLIQKCPLLSCCGYFLSWRSLMVSVHAGEWPRFLTALSTHNMLILVQILY